MHCILQIVTKGKPTMEEIDQIMQPYYESDFLDRYWNPEKEDYDEIPEEAHPAFTWDYYDIWEQDPIAHVAIGNCFAMIDRQKRPHVRTWWNGREHVDKQKDFEYWIQRINREKGRNDWVTLVNYHY